MNWRSECPKRTSGTTIAFPERRRCALLGAIGFERYMRTGVTTPATGRARTARPPRRPTTFWRKVSAGLHEDPAASPRSGSRSSAESGRYRRRAGQDAEKLHRDCRGPSPRWPPHAARAPASAARGIAGRQAITRRRRRSPGSSWPESPREGHLRVNDCRRADVVNDGIVRTRKPEADRVGAELALPSLRMRRDPGRGVRGDHALKPARRPSPRSGEIMPVYQVLAGPGHGAIPAASAFSMAKVRGRGARPRKPTWSPPSKTSGHGCLMNDARWTETITRALDPLAGNTDGSSQPSRRPDHAVAIDQMVRN